MSEVIILRVDSTGKVIAHSDSAQSWVERAGTRLCYRVVGARDTQGASVCNETCASILARGEAEGHDDVSSVVRGNLTRLECQKVGDEVVVVVQRSDVAAPTAEESITKREREVLSLVAQGMTTKEVARQLGLQPCTVRTHVEHARQRLGVRTRAEAVGRAIATGQLEQASGR